MSINVDRWEENCKEKNIKKKERKEKKEKKGKKEEIRKLYNSMLQRKNVKKAIIYMLYTYTLLWEEGLVKELILLY